MENLILYSFLIAVCAVCYKLVLAHQEVLSWWFQFGARFHNKWFYKPVWGCELCFAGQVAAWTYLINWISSDLKESAPFWRFIYFLIPEYDINDFSVLNWLIFITMTILFTNFISKFHQNVFK